MRNIIAAAAALLALAACSDPITYTPEQRAWAAAQQAQHPHAAVTPQEQCEERAANAVRAVRDAGGLSGVRPRETVRLDDNAQARVIWQDAYDRCWLPRAQMMQQDAIAIMQANQLRRATAPVPMPYFSDPGMRQGYLNLQSMR